MMTLRECARMETTMCKCAVSNNVCVQESVLRETTKKMAKQTMEQELSQKLRKKASGASTTGKGRPP